MKQTIEFKDWTPDEQIRELVELEVGHLQRLTRARRPESLFLRVVVDRNTTRTLYRVAITLELPGPDISTSDERHDLREAIHDAFAEIRRQLEKYRNTITHASEYKRPARREQLRRLRVGAAAGKRGKP
jgi:ribosomal subunit interface protein